MRHIRSGGVLLVAALLLAACGSGSEPTSAPTSPTSSPSPSPSASPTNPNTPGMLAHLVPSDRRDDVVVIGYWAESTSPLFGKTAGGEPQGALPDLVRVSMELLGLEVSYEQVEQGKELDLLRNGKITVQLVPATGLDGILETINAVTFLDDQRTFLVREGLELGPEPSELCGLKVGHYDPGSGSRELGPLMEFSAACEAKGLKPIELKKFNAASGFPVNAVVGGTLDATPSTNFHGSLQASKNAGISLGGPVYAKVSTSLLVGKNTSLANPLASAIDELVDNGTYEQIMTEHGLPNFPPKPSRVNPED